MARTELNSSAIPAGAVVSSDLTFPLTNFSSTGIDDNASNTAITINANGSITIAQDILNYVTEAPSDSEQYARINGAWAQVAGGIEYTVSTSNVTATADQGIIADTSAGSFTITLPASPSAGDKVFIADGGDWSNNNLTVARNGSTIEDANTDFTMDYGGVNVGFIYDGSTWQVYPQAGFLGLRGIDDNALSTAITINANNNVGIGTTNPSTLLHLKTSDPKIRLDGDNSSGYSEISTSGLGDLVIHADAGDNVIPAGVLKLRVGPSGDAVTIDQNGNVGIGTTTPSSYTYAGNLVVDTNVAGGITIVSDATNTASYGALYFAEGTTGDEQYRGFIQYDHQNAGVTDRMIIGTAGSTQMTITSDGKLFLGTTQEPSGTSTVRQVIESGTTSGSYIQLSASTTGGLLIGTGSSGGAVFYTHTGAVGSETYTYRMALTADGNLGVGGTPGDSNESYISSSYTMAQIKGNSANKIGSLQIESAGTTYLNTLELAAADSAQSAYIYTGTASMLSLGTNNQGRMNITSGGSVLVNDTSNTLTGGSSGIGSSSLFKVTGSVGSVQVADTGNHIAFSRDATNYISATGNSAALLIDTPVQWFRNGSKTNLVITDTIVNANTSPMRAREYHHQEGFSRTYNFNPTFSSYFAANQWLELAEITPDGASQNYHIKGYIVLQASAVRNIIEIDVGIRSNTLPAMNNYGNYTIKISNTSDFGVVPVFWHDSTNGVTKVLLKNAGTTSIHNVNVHLDISARSASQAIDNIDVNAGTTQLTSVASGYTETVLERHSSTATQTVFCDVQGATTQTLTAATWTKCELGTIVYQQGDNYSTANSRFTAPLTGIYQVNIGVQFNTASGSSGYMYTAIAKNDAIWRYTTGIRTTDGQMADTTLVGTAVLSLAKGDYVDARAYNSAGGNLLGGSRRYMSILQVG